MHHNTFILIKEHAIGAQPDASRCSTHPVASALMMVAAVLWFQADSCNLAYSISTQDWQLHVGKRVSFGTHNQTGDSCRRSLFIDPNIKMICFPFMAIRLRLVRPEASSTAGKGMDGSIIFVCLGSNCEIADFFFWFDNVGFATYSI